MADVRDCCDSYVDQNHKFDCPFLTALDESYKQDSDRHTDALLNHSATALRRRVIMQEIHAAENGHSNGKIEWVRTTEL